MPLYVMQRRYPYLNSEFDASNKLSKNNMGKKTLGKL